MPNNEKLSYFEFKEFHEKYPDIPCTLDFTNGEKLLAKTNLKPNMENLLWLVYNKKSSRWPSKRRKYGRLIRNGILPKPPNLNLLEYYPLCTQEELDWMLNLDLAGEEVSSFKEVMSHSYDNVKDISDSHTASCYFCESTFKISELDLTETTDEETTVICPCWMDSLVFDKHLPNDPGFIRKLHLYAFVYDEEKINKIKNNKLTVTTSFHIKNHRRFRK